MRLDDQKAKLQLEILKLHTAREKTEQQREKEREEERVEPHKTVVIYKNDPRAR
jgi:hypothetical protein